MTGRYICRSALCGMRGRFAAASVGLDAQQSNTDQQRSLRNR